MFASLCCSGPTGLIGRVLLVLTALATWAQAGNTDYVIQISVDGLGSSYASTFIANNPGSNLARFVNQGAYTNNARNDYDITVTLPNHTTMVTGRGIQGTAGHNWTLNSDPSSVIGNSLYSIQNNKGSYISSVFDAAHDAGLSTGVYASKSKFVLFPQSYGFPGATGSKIDAYLNSSSAAITTALINRMSTSPLNYAFVHYENPDGAGHGSGWGSTTYYNAIGTVDGYLGQIFNLIDTNTTLNGHTSVILTADHGGSGFDHSDASLALDYTIPFYVWGADVTAGDLYAMNAATRLDPGTGRPLYSAPVQPIRNGDGANLALELLGSGPISGSTLNAAQDLNVPEPATIGLLALAAVAMLRRR